MNIAEAKSSSRDAYQLFKEKKYEESSLLYNSLIDSLEEHSQHVPPELYEQQALVLSLQNRHSEAESPLRKALAGWLTIEDESSIVITLAKFSLRENLRLQKRFNEALMATDFPSDISPDREWLLHYAQAIVHFEKDDLEAFDVCAAKLVKIGKKFQSYKDVVCFVKQEINASS